MGCRDLKFYVELATKVVKEIQFIINQEIILVDTRGIIIAATDEKRIGTFHEGAYRVLHTKEKLYIDEVLSKKLSGTKPGINMPIMYKEEVVGVIGISGDPKTVEPYAELIRRMTELIIMHEYDMQQIIREAFQLEQLEKKYKTLESFFYDWIQHEKIDAILLNKGKALGIGMDLPYRCILFQTSVADQNKDSKSAAYYKMLEWYEHFYPKNDNDVLIPLDNGVRFVLLKSAHVDIPREQLEVQLNEWRQFFFNSYGILLHIGVSQSTQAQLISFVYKEALKALHISEQINQIVFYEDLTLELLLEDIPLETQKEYIQKTNILKLYDEDLIHTLSVFFQNNNSIKETAKSLYVHVNTLHYRLQQIKKITGIDPKDTKGTVILYLALNFFGKLYNKYQFTTNHNNNIRRNSV